MLFDRALRATFRNFSTLFLVVFLVLAPIHLVYGLVFQDVLALQELHPAIAEFPRNRQVRGIGIDDVARARIWFWIVVGIDLALVPLFTRVCGRVLASDAGGQVPTAVGAWRSIRSPGPDLDVRGGSFLGTIGAGLLLALAVAGLTEALLLVLADLLPDALAFGAIALAQAVGKSAGIPFLAVSLLYAMSARSKIPAAGLPELY